MICVDLVHALDGFSNHLVESLQRFVTIGDTGGAETIWTCSIMCLAHLAALSHLGSQTNSASSASMNGVYYQTLDKLVNLSLEAHIKYYSNFDLLIGVRISQ